MTTRKAVKAGIHGGELLESLRKTQLQKTTVEQLHVFKSGLSSAKDKKVSGRISGDLLSVVKARLGTASDTEAIEMALTNLALTDDFGSWLVEQGGKLTEDFKLEL